MRLEQLAFDSVQVEGRVLTPAEFLELPIDQRIQLNVARRLVFRKGQAVVESHEAMRSLLAAAGRN